MKEKLFSELDDVKKGIVVFSVDGCPRCHYTTSYMLDNGIDFRWINTTKDNERNRLMWELVRKDKPTIKTFKMPVILVNGKISYDIKDLKGLVRNLKH